MVRAALVVAAACGPLLGCSGGDGNTFEQALSFAVEESGSSLALDDETVAEVGSGIHELWYKDLRDGPEVRHLGAARMLDEVGVIGLLESYIVNIPSGAYFLPNFELRAAMSASRIALEGADDDVESRVMHEFERTVLIAVDGDALNRLPAPTAHDPLHEAFFEVFEQCGRDSPWPKVQMAEREGNAAGDVLGREPALDISDYEYRELLHVCGRYAATYPTLSPALREELLAPQRAYFARGILDRIDRELPGVEVPLAYQDEIDSLRQNGW